MDDIQEIVVIGSGPGGYAAAFRAADLGMGVTLIDKDVDLGGVCLNRGCIPSKSLLHISKIINESKESSKIGLDFNSPKIDIEKINSWKNSIIKNLSNGILSLAKARKVNVINGTAKFLSANELSIDSKINSKKIKFKNCIIATGSRSANLPKIEPNGKNILSSRDALNFESIPNKLLIIGGGYIGLEMATFYNAVGSDIEIAEFQSKILSEMDKDLVDVLIKKLGKKVNFMTNTKVNSVIDNQNSCNVAFESEGRTIQKKYDKVLLCVGRQPNTDKINIESTGIETDKYGFINVNNQCRTLVPNIFAIGDVTGNPMLAHRATHQGKIAAEVICGQKSIFEPESIPYVIFTDPEIAWSGPSEIQLKNQGIEFESKIFPWQANGRALSMDAPQGKTKILFCKKSKKILSIGIVGHSAGDLIGEATLAIEMNAFADDIALTIHPHPTLSETIANASEMIEGTITDLYVPK